MPARDALAANLVSELVPTTGADAVVESRELKASLLSMGVAPTGGTLREMAALVQKEIAKWKDVIRLSGARVE